MDSVEPGIFEAWLASTDDGVVAVDAEGLVVLHNPAASRVTGLAPSAARRRPWRDVLQLDPTISDLLWAARLTGRRAVTLANVLCAQGNLRTAETLAHPWTDAAGRTGIVILIRDLTVLCRHRSGPGGRSGYGGMVGADPAMTAVYDLVEAVAASDAPVVIEGESGTGKEAVAQAIHARSDRNERPLIAVDCGVAQLSVLDTEIFGQLRPGPHGTSSIGRAELAHSGTLFLRRVHALPSSTQGRLLRLLETGLFERDGDPTPRRADTRLVVSSTHALEQEVREGRFRDDLFRRLRVVRIRVPALRERPGDIVLLATHFLARHGPANATLSSAASAVLQAGTWPGNVRQLETVIREAATALRNSGRTVVEPTDLPGALVSRADGSRSEAPRRPPEDRRTLLLRALSSHGGNRTAAARSLGIGRATFYRWWRDAGLGAS